MCLPCLFALSDKCLSAFALASRNLKLCLVQQAHATSPLVHSSSAFPCIPSHTSVRDGMLGDMSTATAQLCAPASRCPLPIHALNYAWDLYLAVACCSLHR